MKERGKERWIDREWGRREGGHGDGYGQTERRGREREKDILTQGRGVENNAKGSPTLRN